MTLHHLSMAQMRQGLKDKLFSPAELAQYFLERIARHNPMLNAFITVNEGFSINAQHSQSPLSGLPLAHKDVFCTQGLRTTAGSKMLERFMPPYDAHIVEQLAQAGMTNLGKLNMDEFAMGSTNENSAYGVVRNPWHTAFSPGGSSGGSAVAVAAGLSPFTTASDTGGSIRLPASHCGVTGIKPGYGMVSRYGVIAYASSLDQAGVMARRAEDCAELLQVMMQADTRDSTIIPMSARPNQSDRHLTQAIEQSHNALKGKKMGVCSTLLESLSGAQAQVINDGLAALEKLGVERVEVELKHLDEALAAYYIIATAEASSNLSRFDGVRYGHRTTQKGLDIHGMIAKSRAEGFGAEVKRRILLGTFVLSHGYYDAYYLSALKVRRLIANQFHQMFTQCDFFALPVSPGVAPKLGAHVDPVEDYWQDVYTVPINLAGLPALSMPVGFIHEHEAKCPVGLQLTGPYFSEGLLLSVAHQYQQHSDWHLQYPID